MKNIKAAGNATYSLTGYLYGKQKIASCASFQQIQAHTQIYSKDYTIYHNHKLSAYVAQQTKDIQKISVRLDLVLRQSPIKECCKSKSKDAHAYSVGFYSFKQHRCLAIPRRTQTIVICPRFSFCVYLCKRRITY